MENSTIVVQVCVQTNRFTLAGKSESQIIENIEIARFFGQVLVSL